MRTDHLQQIILNDYDLVDLMMRDPETRRAQILVEPGINIDNGLSLPNWPRLRHYVPSDQTLEEFDRTNQANWLMPEKYQQLDIASHVLSLCNSDAELQRAGAELLLYQQLDAFNLLRYLKYLVDVMQQNNIVWGVGRGSSVASYVLYLLEVHHINSLYYDLDVKEFLKI